MIDLSTRMVVGWQMASHMRTTLVTEALSMAIAHGRVAPNAVFHADAGSQYTSIRSTERLDLESISPSIGSVGDAFDNALMETINGLYKAGCIRTTVFHSGPYKTIADVEFATAGWVDWYNNRRYHGSLGMVSPSEYEANHYATQTLELQPV